jgi:hypothetical protein
MNTKGNLRGYVPLGTLVRAHTEGPWGLYRPHRESFWHVNQRCGPGYICDVPLYEHRAAECKANALLIAAAPALLDALIAAVNAGIIDIDGEPDKARAAIAAATGEQA